MEERPFHGCAHRDEVSAYSNRFHGAQHTKLTRGGGGLCQPFSLSVNNRVHNTYTLASAWRIVLNILRTLEEDKLSGITPKTRLAKSENLRTRYLALYDMVNALVSTSQAKFSVLATTTRKAPIIRFFFFSKKPPAFTLVLIYIYIQLTTPAILSMKAGLMRITLTSYLIGVVSATLASRSLTRS